jgi:hypothetical protein
VLELNKKSRFTYNFGKKLWSVSLHLRIEFILLRLFLEVIFGKIFTRTSYAAGLQHKKSPTLVHSEQGGRLHIRIDY